MKGSDEAGRIRAESAGAGPGACPWPSRLSADPVGTGRDLSLQNHRASP